MNHNDVHDEDLVDSPDLGAYVFAGASGLDREVRWAQVCELPNPTEWLSSDELLLTVGYTVPKDPLEQKAYIEPAAMSENGCQNRFVGLVVLFCIRVTS